MLGVSIHTDAGLGNQIWRYVVCRVLADRLGYDYGVSHPGWRGPFLNIDWGKEVDYNDDDLINPADFVPTENLKLIIEKSLKGLRKLMVKLVVQIQNY